MPDVAVVRREALRASPRTGAFERVSINPCDLGVGVRHMRRDSSIAAAMRRENRRAAVGSPAEPGSAPRLRLVRPERAKRGLAMVMAIPRPRGHARGSRVARRGFASKPTDGRSTRVLVDSGCPADGVARLARGSSIAAAIVRASACGRGLARKAGQRTTATTGAPVRAEAGAASPRRVVHRHRQPRVGLGHLVADRRPLAGRSRL